MPDAIRLAPKFASHLLCFLFAAVSLGLASGSSVCFAQVHYSGTQVEVSTAFSLPSRLAMDSKGDVFVSDVAMNQILEEIPDGSTYRQVVLPTSALSGPFGVAVDPGGNVFVSDSGHNRILRESPTPSGFTETVLPTSALNTPHCVFADAAGNVFICDTNNLRVLRETPSGDHYVETVVDNRIWCPSGIAEDAQGDLYIADTNSGVIFKDTPFGSTYTQSVVATGWLGSPTGVAVDSAGDLYISLPSANQLIKETPLGSVYQQTVLASSNLSYPDALLLDAAGQLYFVDTYNHRVVRQQLLGTEFGAVPVAEPASSGPRPKTPILTIAPAQGSGALPSTSLPVASVVITADAATTLGAAPIVTRQGTAAADFTVADTSTCAAGLAMAAGSSCTIDVLFAPSLAGSVSGAVVLPSSTGAVLATGYLHGTGTAPLVAFSPPYETSVGSGLNHAQGLAADAVGNLYVADTGNRRILKETFSGGAYTQSVVATTSLAGPLGVAIDGSGNVFASDTGNNRVLEEAIPPPIAGAAASGGAIESTLEFPLLKAPAGVAIDGMGNVYLADTGNNRILMKAPQTSSSTSAAAGMALSIPGLKTAYGVAVDGAGNLYLADSGNNRILKETYAAGTYAQSIVPSTALALPKAVAVDANGDVFIADTGNGRILEESLVNGSYTEKVLRSGLGAPDALALDAGGSLYITDSANSLVLKESFATGPALAFAPTSVGNSSAAQLVTLANMGNAPLTFPVPAAGNNPAVSAGFSVDTSLADACPSVSAGHDPGADLAPGQSCVFSLSFAPTMLGSQQGDLVVSDSNLNSLGAMQSVSLSGSGQAAAAGLVMRVPASVTYGNAVQVSAQVGPVNGDALVSGGTVSFADDSGSFGIQALVSGLATASYLPRAAGSYTLKASFAPASDTMLAASGQAVLQVTPAPLNVAADSGTRVYGAQNPPFTGSISGAVSGDSFTETFSTTATAASPVAGYSIVPSAKGPRLSNYSANIQNGTLQVTPASLHVKAADASRSYGAPNPTFTGSLTGLVNGDVLTLVYSTTATTASPAAQYAIVPSLAGAAMTNYTPVVENGTLRIMPAALAVSAADAVRVYGAANPVFTGSLLGVVNGDQLTEQFTTTATATSAPGTYAIVPAALGAALANYQPSVSNGTLTITPAPLTYTAADVTRVYGAANPVFTGTITGALAGDVFTESFATAAGPDSPVGTYPVVASIAGPALGNYTPIRTNGLLTITPAPLRVLPADATRVYGTANPVFTGMVTGALQGDAIVASYTSSADASSPAGQYPIVAQLAGPVANYSVTLSSGVLTVSKASSTITLSEQMQTATGSLSVLLSAQVNAPAGASGMVRFLNGATELGQASLTNGTATLMTSQLRIGVVNPLVAVYQGDQNVLPSSSAVLPVLPSASGFWIKTLPGGTGLSATAGVTVLVPLRVGPGALGIYPGQVSFTVSGLPSGATGTFSPASITAESGEQNVTLSVQLPPAAATVAVAPWLSPGWRQGAGRLALALVLLPLAGARRLRKAGRCIRLTLLLVVASLAGVSMLSGCGFSPGSGLSSVEAKPVTYTLTITMTSGGLTQSVPATVTVTPPSQTPE